MPKKVKFVLHIGANKTGTSSIQNMLAHNREALAKAGWVYPDFYLLHQAHHRLAYSISGQRRESMIPGDWKAAFAELTASDEQRFIFSSEVLFRLAPPADVARVFPPEQTQVVLYLRDHLSYMSSWYAQAIQERNLTSGFRDYVRAFPQPLSGFLKAWEDVYGQQNVTLRNFSRETLHMQDSRLDFIHCLDALEQGKSLGGSLTLATEASNPSISGNLLFFKRVLNNYMTLEEARGDPITDEFGAFATVKDSFQGKFLITAQDVNVVRDIFRDDILLLQQRGLPFGDFPEQVAGHSIPDYATLHDDMRLIKKIAVQTDKQFLTYANRWQDWHTLEI